MSLQTIHTMHKNHFSPWPWSVPIAAQHGEETAGAVTRSGGSKRIQLLLAYRTYLKETTPNKTLQAYPAICRDAQTGGLLFETPLFRMGGTFAVTILTPSFCHQKRASKA